MAPRAVCVCAGALPVLYPGHGERQQQQENFWAQVSSIAQGCMVIFSKVFIFSLFIAESYLKKISLSFSSKSHLFVPFPLSSVRNPLVSVVFKGFKAGTQPTLNQC